MQDCCLIALVVASFGHVVGDTAIMNGFCNSLFFLRISVNSLPNLNLEDRLFSVVLDCLFNREADSVIGVTEFMEYKLLYDNYYCLETLTMRSVNVT